MDVDQSDHGMSAQAAVAGEAGRLAPRAGGSGGWVRAAAGLAAAGVVLSGSPVLAGESVVPDDAALARLPAPRDLTELSLEELAMVEVTSVTRRPEALSHAAAAVFVITAEDIRRSGATSLPEVLRLAPNLQVQRVNAGDYAISARGFNGYETANKLLVLIDGRSVYSQLHSGVFWDERHLPLMDIARIEVISGPGGALYGANAVNGVINIITRSAQDTQGLVVDAAAGTEDAVLTFRHGGRLGEAGGWRAYVSGFDRGESLLADGAEAGDGLSGLRAGMRLDWTGGPDSLSLQADVFDHEAVGQVGIAGGNVTGGWSRVFADGAALQLQAYYDRVERASPGTRETADTVDLSLQHALDLGARHRLVVGGNLRQIDTELIASTEAFLDPPRETVRLGSVFAQDQISLASNVILTLGAKFEDNSLSGAVLLPSARLAWTPPGGSLVWGAVSRATRSPNRIERRLTQPGFLEPGDFRAEDLVAYEIGYRTPPHPRGSLSVSVFYNRYDDLRTVTIDPETVFPLRFDNGGRGASWGLEAWGVYAITPSWRVNAGLATLTKDFEVKPGVLDITGLVSVGDDPDYQLLLGTQADLTDRLELDVRLRAVDGLAAVPSYVEADVRLGWRLTDALEVAVTGANLLDRDHRESGDPGRARNIGRSLTASLRARF